MDARATNPTHARRHTVAGAELRRVLAAATTSYPRTPATHPPIPPFFSAHPSTAPSFGASLPSSSSTSPGTSPPSSTPTSAAGSPLVTPSAAPCTALPRTFDVSAAADVCKRIEGYVSFMDIEGLGAPSGLDGDDGECDGERPKKERSWSWGAALFGIGAAPLSTPTSPTSTSRRLPPVVEDPMRSKPVAVRAPRKTT